MRSRLAAQLDPWRVGGAAATCPAPAEVARRPRVFETRPCARLGASCGQPQQSLIVERRAAIANVLDGA